MKTTTSSQPYWTEATVAPDGSLVLDSPSRLPLKPGEKVAILLSPLPKESQESAYTLRGTVLRYEDPFGSATELEDWEALSNPH